MMRTALYPATLDPIHNGHIDVAIRAAHLFDQIIVAIYAEPKKNLLFTVDERIQLAEHAFKDFGNISVAKYSGLTVNYAQTIGATAIIRGLRVFGDFELEFRMGLANKKLAPGIESVFIMADEKHIYISSSTIREIAELGGDVNSMVPPYVAEALSKRFGDIHHP